MNSKSLLVDRILLQKVVTFSDYWFDHQKKVKGIEG